VAKKRSKSMTVTERRKWYHNQSPEQKSAFIKKTMQAKADRRRNRSIALMKNHEGEYDCKDCIHGKTKSCTDKLKNGCEYYYNADNGKKGLLELNPRLHRT